MRVLKDQSGKVIGLHINGKQYLGLSRELANALQREEAQTAKAQKEAEETGKKVTENIANTKITTSATELDLNLSFNKNGTFNLGTKERRYRGRFAQADENIQSVLDDIILNTLMCVNSAIEQKNKYLETETKSLAKKTEELDN